MDTRQGVAGNLIQAGPSIMKATSPPCGFSADTEILTRHGWMRFSQLTYMSEVAARSPEGVFEWQYPEKITCQPYEGEMVWFRSRTADLLVTPDHPVLYRQRKRDCSDGKRVELKAAERSGPAGSLAGKVVSLVAASTWVPPQTPHEISLSARRGNTPGTHGGRHPRDFVASVTDFAAFMGMFLSEGYLGSAGHDYPVCIAQTPQGKGFTPYQDLLDRMMGRHVPWRRAGNGNWCISSKPLYQYLAKCGRNAWGKRIPPGILDLSAADLETFWHYYWLGDGSDMSSPGRREIEVIQTTSRAMADGLQEVLQKTGRWSIIHAVTRKDRGDICGVRVGSRHPLYRLVRRAGLVACATHVEMTSRSGMITCITVPNGTVYVRRNDHPVWAGSGGTA